MLPHTVRPLRFAIGASLFLIALASSSLAQTESVLYSFDSSGVADGMEPTSALVEDASGALYGTTPLGGTGCSNRGCGVVFRLTPPVDKGAPWTESILYNFGSSANDGTYPGQFASLILDKNGNLYGTTSSGGTGNCNPNSELTGCGTVFELSPPEALGESWTENILYSFQGVQAVAGTPLDGSDPQAGLVLDARGNLFGTTAYGGSGSQCTGNVGACGTVFELSPTAGGSWTEKIIHNFGNTSNDGANPYAPLILVENELLGTTLSGGSNYSCGDSNDGCGLLFALIPPTTGGGKWMERTASVGPLADGATVFAGLVRGFDGKIYGVASQGGSGQCQDDLQNTVGCGVVFQVTPPIASTHWGPVEVIYNFTGGSDGGVPQSTLLADKIGNLYGVAPAGGSCLGGYSFEDVSGCGTLFQLTPNSGGTSWSEKTIYQFQGRSSGATPWSIVPKRANGFFGVTSRGGSLTCNCGTVFEFKP